MQVLQSLDSKSCSDIEVDGVIQAGRRGDLTKPALSGAEGLPARWLRLPAETNSSLFNRPAIYTHFGSHDNPLTM